MDKTDRLIELFKDFKCTDFMQYQHTGVTFSCDNENECKVDKRSNPIWSPALGDKMDKADLMLVGEAPAGGAGFGPHIAGLFRELSLGKKNNSFMSFRDFFSKELRHTPYYTDLIKCGPQKAGDKPVIDRRAKLCFERYLSKEIKIIDPISIYCIGSRSYKTLSKLKLRRANGDLITLVQLIHFGKNAGLHLSDSDKEIIWRFQLGKLEDVSLSELSFFKKQSH